MTYDELVRAWSETGQDLLPLDEQDRLALECAREMAAAGGERAYQWAFGQVLMLPRTELAGGEVPEVVADAARAVRRASSAPDCAHEEHPFEESWVDLVDWLPDVLLMLADDSVEWLDNYDKGVWLCPRTVDGFAAMILQALRPGSAPDAPPLLPFADRRALDSLTAILEGYPELGTDIGAEVAEVGRRLRWADGPDRAGVVITAAALTWWDGTARSSEEAYGSLVQGFEAVLDGLGDPGCGHAEHPALPRWANLAVCLGIHLSSPGGRGVYERQGACLKNPPPLEPLLCPAFTASVAQDSLVRLRQMRAEPDPEGAA
ncbi:hypothetical protein G6045_29000 [Streptomyces sp. YC504]|uniref:Uncharacterized protein n=1 Tax=Streptomyces mesophilus TaxID=1775132 RepID=A0A6G4XQ34_9ACTN|nr:hypothetical protein [Streptomyces mesophilus]NGO79665.1 hypothetical protein [Streptomyces mesophilus]